MKPYNEARIERFNEKFVGIEFINPKTKEIVIPKEFDTEQYVKVKELNGTKGIFINIPIDSFFKTYQTVAKYEKHQSDLARRRVNKEREERAYLKNWNKPRISNTPVCIVEVLEDKSIKPQVLRVPRNIAKKLVAKGNWRYSSKGAWKRYLNELKEYIKPNEPTGLRTPSNNHGGVGSNSKSTKGRKIVHKPLIKYEYLSDKEIEGKLAKWRREHPNRAHLKDNEIPIKRKRVVNLSKNTRRYLYVNNDKTQKFI